MPRVDHQETLGVLRDQIGKADAFITVVEDLIELCWGDGETDDDDCIVRRRNHVAHLIESAKLAVQAAAYAGEALANRRRGA